MLFQLGKPFLLMDRWPQDPCQLRESLCSFFPTFPALTAVTSQTSPYPPANPPSRQAQRAAGAADAVEPYWHLGMDGWIDWEQGSGRMQMVSFAGAKGGGESGLMLKSTQRCQDPALEEPRRDWMVMHHPHIPQWNKTKVWKGTQTAPSQRMLCQTENLSVERENLSALLGRGQTW